MTRIQFTAITLVTSLCFSSWAMAQRSDQVASYKDAPVSGAISEITKTHITIKGKKVEVLDIKRVTFGEDPQELSKARDHILSGQYANGLNELKKIDVNEIQREFVKHDVMFYTALAQAKLALIEGGDKAAARQALLSFVTTAKDSFHFFEAAQVLGDLAIALEAYEDAAKYYGAIAKLAPWPEYQMRSGVLEGRALEAQAKFPEAMAKYDAVIANPVDTPGASRQKDFARIGKAVGLAETGKPDDGVKLVEEIITKRDEKDAELVELFGRAYNALGRCQLKLNKPKEALMAYLHVDLLFFNQSNPDVHAEALFHLTKLWPTVNKSDRAVAARSTLNERYSGSPWAKRN